MTENETEHVGAHTVTEAEQPVRGRLTVRDRWRRWSYLQDVDLWLSALPGRRRRAILRDLRTSLTDAAEDSSMDNAIDELGPARRLAREYVDGEPANRPVWYLGVIAGLVVLCLSVLAFATYAAGMIAALGAADTSTASSTFLGVEVTAENSAAAYGASFEGLAWPVLVMTLLAWLIGARAWRLLRRRT